jgi:hypothetical protein
MEKTMKYFSEYLVAATLAFGVLTLAAIDAHAKVVCGPDGCHRVYPYRSQWPVGQRGKYYNTAPWGCAVVGGQRVCHQAIGVWRAESLGVAAVAQFSPGSATLRVMTKCSAAAAAWPYNSQVVPHTPNLILYDQFSTL